MTKWAFVADLNRCVGCQTCTAACKHANATAPGVQWRKVLDFETGTFPEVHRAFLPVGCMHCETPSCLEVCPSTATGKREDGVVTIDYDLCIGCAYCAVSCPYQARYRVDSPNAAYGGAPMRHERKREFWGRRSVAQKCTLCTERLDAGIAEGLRPGEDMEATPACVAACISGALQMGDLDDPGSTVSALLGSRSHFRMHEGLGNGPNLYYLYGESGGKEEPLQVPMVPEPVGLAAVSPKLQISWDWRAAVNFICGGTGTGLMAAAVVFSLFVPVIWPAVLTAMAVVAFGLLCIWLEIGRPWRLFNVFRNPRTSWMSREAWAALPFFGFSGLGWLLEMPVLVGLGALGGLAFLYCQGRILRAAKGIPAWRQPEIVALIAATGLAEGTGIFAVFAGLSGADAPVISALAGCLLALVASRFALWTRYRAALEQTGAPTASFRALDAMRAGLGPLPQVVAAALALFTLLLPVGQGPLLALAGLLVAVTGWVFKLNLITRVGFTQGYALNRMPSRGAGPSSPGIQPGWFRA
jgi:phenylacetyl-CoA:acceptor oxidoreductase subunit 1